MSQDLFDLIIILALGVTAVLSILGIGHYCVTAYDKLRELWRKL
jgi:hypothetical protein